MKKYLGLILLMLPLVLFAQQAVSGKVVDTQNLPLPGASVLVKGTTKGAVTGMDGTFTIKLKSSPTILLVSYLGFVTQEIVVTTQKEIIVTLLEDQQALDEVIVI
ncbi:carboxypeptidase-like regulatory domain-containing protein, partial [bacterium]|nr:carboxypeptidase-like regulatory domain-containing protein [bacterium]